jgi:hypothetical protein
LWEATTTVATAGITVYIASAIVHLSLDC